MCAKLKRGGFVMVNFTSQFDWAMGRPDIWLNVILGICESVSG
jgi:hypothetical protein